MSDRNQLWEDLNLTLKDRKDFKRHRRERMRQGVGENKEVETDIKFGGHTAVPGTNPFANR